MHACMQVYVDVGPCRYRVDSRKMLGPCASDYMAAGDAGRRSCRGSGVHQERHL